MKKIKKESKYENLIEKACKEYIKEDKKENKNVYITRKKEKNMKKNKK